MKKIVTIVAAMLFVFAVGSALADQLPILSDNREVGTLMNFEAPGKVLISPAKDFGGPPIRELAVDAGTVLYISAFEKSEVVTGAAAGGVAREDENTIIWNNLMPKGEGE